MNSSIAIALDAMGGDHAPAMVIAGALLALRKDPTLVFHIYGDETRLRPLMERHPSLQSAIIHHTPDVVPGDMKPSVALRQGRQSSMRMAIDSVKDGTTQGMVSAGNTGALMAISKFVLGLLPGIDRPAITSMLPTSNARCVMLDLGANLECGPDNLVQFAIMGALIARIELGIEAPRVGLLNIGSEEMKGHDEIRAAASILRDTPIPGRFIGYVEADEVPFGRVDVVVTDGFTGNIALKTLEGTAKLAASFLRQAMHDSMLAKLGAMLASGAFSKLRTRLDPRAYNGAMLAGLRGVCVKSHGGADARAFANAILVAAQLIEGGLNNRIREEFARLYGVPGNSNGVPDQVES
ncbi:MAG: phosphate acyltransferase PlsX [Proteobacteria bacterium]|nr:phosphate acyltransferase PlsX [Pseudomonadota bacterium]